MNNKTILVELNPIREIKRNEYFFLFCCSCLFFKWEDEKNKKVGTNRMRPPPRAFGLKPSSAPGRLKFICGIKLDILCISLKNLSSPRIIPKIPIKDKIIPPHKKAITPTLIKFSEFIKDVME